MPRHFLVRGTAAALLSGAWAASCAASYITLDLRPGAAFQGGEATVSATISNRGDEAACAVWWEGRAGAASGRSAPRVTLAPNDVFATTIRLGAAPTPPGLHTVVLTVHYTDANGYPFTALHAVSLLTGEPDPAAPQIVARLSPGVLTKRGEVALTLSTPAAETADVSVTLALPDEIAAERRVFSVRVPPGAGVTTNLALSNLTALPGSVYKILAVVDHVRDGRHYSVAAGTSVVIRPSGDGGRLLTRYGWPAWIALMLVLFTLAHVGQGKGRRPVAEACRRLTEARGLLSGLVLAAVTAFIVAHLSPLNLLRDTTTVGGDTPAHLYLASHLKDQLLHHGRIVSWAGGWWCGFPMFQFYFCLPYLMAALLSLVLPLAVAFKWVTVSGIVALPFCAYASGRLMRLPRPVPALLAVAAVPFLFDRAHVMWGANIHSTLAGMIANSVSFAIMLPALGAAWRDADDGVFRLRTVALLTAMLASHFFTSVVAGLAALIFPLLRPHAGFRRALRVLAAEGALALLLMAWWLAPLVMRQSYAMEFGTDWEVDPRIILPAAWVVVPLAAAGVVAGLLGRIRGVAVVAWWFAVAAFLFAFGSRLAPVFVNVRLWPFMTWSALALAAMGAGLWLARSRVHAPAVLALLAAVLAYGPERPEDVRSWAKWNYAGLEQGRRWDVFQKLVLPLKDTPGRLANDLHPSNNALGSTRIFECVPYLIGKPILEGGLVNSAAGAMFSYYIQSETSMNCAGFPTIVQPATFNFTNATRHLALFNVKHFIARWEGTQAALAASRDWKRLASCQEWELYELLAHDGRYVFIPPRYPAGVRTDRWKEAGLDWIYTIDCLDQPFVLLRQGEPVEPVAEILDEAAYARFLSSVREGSREPLSRPTAAGLGAISRETVTDDRIRFTTTAIGQPHIVKCMYYPNWKVRGARHVFMVTPCFMLVYPDQAEVELYYGRTWPDNAGLALTLAGIVLAAGAAWRRSRHGIRSHEPSQDG